MLAPLRSSNFRRLFLAVTLSGFGDHLYLVAVSLLVLERGGGATEVGLVLGSRFFGIALLSLVGGVVSDSFSRIMVLRWTEVIRGAAVAAMVVAPGGSGAAPVIALALVLGAAEGFSRPAVTAAMTELITPAERVDAFALKSFTDRFGAVTAPLVAGFAAAVGSPSVPLLLDVLTFGLAASMLLSVPAGAPAGGGANMLAAAREGLRAVRSDPWVRRVLTSHAFRLSFALAPMQLLLPVLLTNRGEGGEAEYGLVLAALSLGAAMGAAVTPSFGSNRPGVIAHAGILMLVMLPLSLAFPTDAFVVAGAWFVGGLGVEAFEIRWTEGLYRTYPDILMGRVLSIDVMARFSLLPVGFAVAGPIHDRFGPTPLLGASLAIIVATVGWALATPGGRSFSRGSPNSPSDPPAGSHHEQ